MKHIFILIFCMILCVSCCIKYSKCQVNYSVVYPDTTIVYDTIFNCFSDDVPYTSSTRGTNYILLGDKVYSRTTCPIRINSYKKIND